MKAKKASTLRRLCMYLLQYKWLLLLALALTVGSNLFALIGPALCGRAIDLAEMGPGKVDLPAVERYALWMALFYVASAVMTYLLNVLMIVISRKVTYRMRRDMFRRLADLPVGYFDSHPVGDIISRISYDTDTINGSLSTDLVQIFASVITVAGSLIMMLRIAPKLVLVFAVTVPLSMLITRCISKKTQPLFRLRSRRLGELNGFAEEMISGQKTLKAYCQEENTLSELDEYNERAVEAYYQAEYHVAGMGPSTNFINNLSLTLISVFGAMMYMAGGITVGNISSFVLYSRKFSGPIREVADIFNELQSSVAAAERVFRIMDERPEPPDPENARPLGPVQGAVELEHISFGYTPGRPVLHDLSLQIRPGQLIAIVGPTGCGKTTLINLLMRFYDVNSGSIKVSGTDIRDVTRASLRGSYGMVLQDTWLRAGTVRENIAYGKPDATMDEVIAAAKAAHAHSFIRRLPDGYDTVIAEDGGNISQGQKQLLCIARVMLCLPPMLILDEATSSIDTRTEVRIQKAFARMMQGRTSFIVAHRLSTIREADVILVMKDGHIVEQGNHDQLLAQGGFYAKLYNSQFEGVQT